MKSSKVVPLMENSKVKKYEQQKCSEDETAVGSGDFWPCWNHLAGKMASALSKSPVVTSLEHLCHSYSMFYWHWNVQTCANKPTMTSLCLGEIRTVSSSMNDLLNPCAIHRPIGMICWMQYKGLHGWLYNLSLNEMLYLLTRMICIILLWMKCSCYCVSECSTGACS